MGTISGTRALYQLLHDAIQNRRPAVMVTIMKSGRATVSPGEKVLILDDIIAAGGFSEPYLEGVALEVAVSADRLGRVMAYTYEDVQLLVEPIIPRPELVVVGAGHLAVPLAGAGRLAGFDVVVVDDRPNLAISERFPDAHQVLCGALDEQLAKTPLDTSTAVVVCTRSQQLDLACLRQVLGSPARYIGLYGSHRRIRDVMGQLAQEGVGEAILRSIHAPPGFDLGVDDPEGIAIAIVAEILQVLRGGNGEPLDQRFPKEDVRWRSY